MRLESYVGVFLAIARIKFFVGRRLVLVRSIIRFVCVLFLGVTVSWAATVPIDGVVAIVGRDVITAQELDLEITRTINNFQAQGQSVPDRLNIRQQVLERLVTLKALGALADRTGIRVTDDEVRRGFQSIARQNGMEVAEYLDQLKQSGGSVSELREQIVSQAKILKLRQRDLESNIVVSDAEVKSFLKKQSQTEGTSDESLLAHILIQIPEGAGQNEVDAARQRAEDAVNRIDGGMDFRQVAAEMSDATDALDGGLLGWRDASTLPSLFLEALKEMRVGGRSDVLQSPNGFHILFLFDKRGLNAQVIVQETLARHILIRVDELSSDEDALREITNIRNQILFDGADFSELAKSSSDDGSASNGGLLNWMMPGETVEPFDRAMNNLKIGEVSEPVRTQFGYHLIEVMERRDADVSEERREAVARQSIRQKKLEFRFQEWVQEVKDTTYIKYVN